MLMKALVALLVALNLAFLAWSLGVLDGSVAAGWRSTGDREPERLARQVRPESIRVLPAGAASQAAAASAASAAAAASVSAADVATRCLEAGPFAENELAAAQTTVQGILTAGASEVVRSDRPALWIVYMGRYGIPGALQRKEEELNRRGVVFEVLDAPENLAPGLALGRHPDRASAERELAELGRKGVRTGRVLQLEPAGVDLALRVARADPPTARRLQALVSDPTLRGKAFGGCVGVP